MGWRTSDAEDLSEAAIRALLEDEIPAVRITDLAGGAECEAFAEAVDGQRDRMTSYAGTSGAAGFIGVSQYQYRQEEGTKQAYWDAMPAAEAQLREVTSATFDPVARLRDRLREEGGIALEPAEEPGYGEYFPCIIRYSSGGIWRHYDYAPFNTPGWSIAGIDVQLTWNLYVQAPLDGGATTVFEALAASDTPGNEKAMQGIPEQDAAESAARFSFAPRVGEVVLFNSRNLHEVSPGTASEHHERISIGSFLGWTAGEERLVMWG